MKTPKVGGNVIVIGYSSGHNFPMGMEVQVTKVMGKGQIQATLAGYGNQTMYANDYKVKSVTKETLQEDKDALLAEIAKIDRSLEYLQLSGKKEVDENEIVAYNVLKTLAETNMTDVQRAGEIAKLFS